MDYKREFWDDSDKPNPTLTDEILERAEKELNCTLPELLIELLKIQNGGYTQGFVFPTDRKTSWSDNHIPFDELLGIAFKAIDDSRLSILDSNYLTDEWGLPEKQIVLAGDGHWWITLDYRNNGDQPAVSWIDMETAQDIQLANSFDVFIEGLVSINNFKFES